MITSLFNRAPQPLWRVNATCEAFSQRALPTGVDLSPSTFMLIEAIGGSLPTEIRLHHIIQATPLKERTRSVLIFPVHLSLTEILFDACLYLLAQSTEDVQIPFECKWAS